MSPQPSDPSARAARNRCLARIHIAKRDLGLDEGAYRALLRSLAGVDSAADLDPAGLLRVLARLRQRRAGIGPSPRLAAPPEKRPLLSRIRALLGDRPIKYAAAILRRQGGPEALEWATPAQLHKVAAALEYDRRRRQRREAQQGFMRWGLLMEAALTLLAGLAAGAAWTLILLALEA